MGNLSLQISLKFHSFAWPELQSFLKNIYIHLYWWFYTTYTCVCMHTVESDLRYFCLWMSPLILKCKLRWMFHVQPCICLKLCGYYLIASLACMPLHYVRFFLLRIIIGNNFLARLPLWLRNNLPTLQIGSSLKTLKFLKKSNICNGGPPNVKELNLKHSRHLGILEPEKRRPSSRWVWIQRPANSL